MSRRGGKKDDSWMLGWILLAGVPTFLLMVHPVIFWLIFVPIVIFLIARIVIWLKK